jgi:hypothetical protein
MNVTIVLKINKKYNGIYTKKGDYLNLDYSYRQSDPFSKKDFFIGWKKFYLLQRKIDPSREEDIYVLF